MINLNECKFGDKLRTKGGRMAIFIEHGEFKGSITVKPHTVIIQSIGTYSKWRMVDVRDDGVATFYSNDSNDDIVGRWEDKE